MSTEAEQNLTTASVSTRSEQSPDLGADLAAIETVVRSVADRYPGEGVALLKILRLLELLHRHIREDLFQQSLPDNRQALHAMLRDMEAEGGWPYINRMRLQSLLVNLSELMISSESASGGVESVTPAESSGSAESIE